MSHSIHRIARTRSAVLAAATVAGALTLSVALAAPAHAADTDKPVLVGSPSFAPAAVDTTTGDATSVASVPLSDSSGVASARLTFTAPDGVTSDLPLDLTSGGAANGVWSGPQTFATVFDAPGRWTPTSLTATDTAGNTATITTGLGNGVTMTRTADTTLPTLLGASAATNRVDTTAGPADVVVRVDATDDLAGVAGGRVTFTSPDGQDTAEGYLTGRPVRGSATDGGWDVTVTFPARSAAGVWRLTGIAVTDAQYNEHGYGLDDDEVPPLSVRVTTTADSTPPALTSFTVGPAKRSTAYGRSGVVWAQVGFSDAVSGVASAQVTLLRPNGVADDADADPVVLAQTTLKTGTSRSGSVLVPITVDNFATGVWKVASVAIDDAAGNTTTVPTAQLPGARTTFEVSSAAADTLAPTATGYVFSPATLDTRSAAQTGSVLVAAADIDAVPSGVASGVATLSSPSGLQTATAAFTADDLVAGDQASGTFRAGFTLPRNAEDGVWKVTSVVVTDAAKRSATVTSFGSTGDLTVLGEGRAAAVPPGAPVLGTATVLGTTATVNWTPPTSDGGALVTRYQVTTYRDGNLQGTQNATGTSAAVPNLLRGRSYSFTVAAANSAGLGDASPMSNTVVPPPIAPAAPTVGRAELTDATTASITWTAPSDDGGAAVDGYRVTPYLNAVAQPAVTVTGTATSTSIGDLARGRTYTFRVAATNAAGIGAASQASNAVSIAATVPAAPVVSSSMVKADSVVVRWTAADDGGSPVVGYDVTGSPAGACTSSTTTCTVTGLTPGQAYSFTVVARNAVGSSPSSEPSPDVVADEPLRQTRLVISSAPKSVSYGSAVAVTGRVTASDGSAVSGRTVRLQYRATSSSAWTTYSRTATTNSDGSARVTGFVPQRTVQVRLVSAEATPYAAATSATRTVTVTRQVTLGAKSGKAKRGSKIVLSGRAYPARAGAIVKLQRWTKRAWHTVSTQRTSGSYKFTVTVRKRGTYSYRVIAPADSSYAASTSRVKALHVR